VNVGIAFNTSVLGVNVIVPVPTPPKKRKAKNEELSHCGELEKKMKNYGLLAEVVVKSVKFYVL
jgi:hypothetical protein